jgi:uncharacterized membrane protein
VLTILLWWAAPLAAAVLAAIVIAITRRVRAARGDMETMERYRRAREVLARGAASGQGEDGGVRTGAGGGRARQE